MTEIDSDRSLVGESPAQRAPTEYDPTIALQDITEETQRQLNLCNACRYCEGYCPVFPAMAQQRWHDASNSQQVDHLAHLCHNCAACYHACQYKPPHMYAVSLPAALDQARLLSYKTTAWPRALAAAFDKNPMVSFLIASISLMLVLLCAFTLNGSAMTTSHSGPGAFYAVISHSIIVLCATSTLGFALFAMTVTWGRYAQVINLRFAELTPGIWFSAVQDALTLRHLGGGHGEGCNVEDERFSNQRRVWHQLTAYGFGLCFAATCVATVYELGFGWLSPFPVTSLPVLLGCIGGLGLIAGPIGLLVLAQRQHSATTTRTTQDLGAALCVNLLAISITGFALLIARETPFMGTLLAVHLGLVLAFFLGLPYGKLIHVGYRLLALLKYHHSVAR